MGRIHLNALCNSEVSKGGLKFLLKANLSLFSGRTLCSVANLWYPLSKTYQSFTEEDQRATGGEAFLMRGEQD